jgi:hypothetical protein
VRVIALFEFVAAAAANHTQTIRLQMFFDAVAERSITA